MRQVYALLGLVGRWAPERVEAARARALAAELISLPPITRMIERAAETTTVEVRAPRTAHHSARYVRDLGHFATNIPSDGRASPPAQLSDTAGDVA
jgi:hypothetical protein